MKNYDLTKMREMPPKNFVTYGCLTFAVVSLACAIFIFLIPRPTMPINPPEDLLYRLGPIICLFSSGFGFCYFFSFLKQKKYFKLINEEYHDGGKVLVRTISHLKGVDFFFLLLDARDWRLDGDLRVTIEDVIRRANEKMFIFDGPFWVCLYNPAEHYKILEKQNSLVRKLERVMDNHLLY